MFVHPMENEIFFLFILFYRVYKFPAQYTGSTSLLNISNTIHKDGWKVNLIQHTSSSLVDGGTNYNDIRKNDLRSVL